MKHFSEGNTEDSYEGSISHHMPEDYDPMKEYETHIGCNYCDEYYDYSNDDEGGIKHFQE